MYKDEAQYGFTNWENFKNFLTQVEENITMIPAKIKDIQFVATNTKTDFSEFTFTDMEIYQDTIDNSKFSVVVEDKEYYVGISSIPSLNERLGTTGNFFRLARKKNLKWYIDTIEKAAVLNAKKDTVLYVENGKVRAFLSNRYVYVSIAELIKAVEAECTDWDFQSGFWSHDYCCMTFTNSNPDVLKEYSYSHVVNGVYITISTSNTTINGVNIVYGIDTRGYHIPLGDGKEFAMYHIASASIDLFKENLNKCFSVYKNKKLIDALSHLDVEIEYPVSCLKGLLKKSGGIPKTLKAECIRYFQDTKPLICYAIDIYFAIASVIKFAQEAGYEWQKLIFLEEAVARLLRMDFKNYDIPEETI